VRRLILGEVGGVGDDSGPRRTLTAGQRGASGCAGGGGGPIGGGGEWEQRAECLTRRGRRGGGGGGASLRRVAEDRTLDQVGSPTSRSKVAGIITWRHSGDLIADAQAYLGGVCGPVRSRRRLGATEAPCPGVAETCVQRRGGLARLSGGAAWRGPAVPVLSAGAGRLPGAVARENKPGRRRGPGSGPGPGPRTRLPGLPGARDSGRRGRRSAGMGRGRGGRAQRFPWLPGLCRGRGLAPGASASCPTP
jgi:hypothetical protein